jgi:hypothetical protein
MTTSDNKNKWRDRLKTADNALTSELLHNFGLSGGPSLRDVPWLALTGFGGAVGVSKMRERKERKQQEQPDDNKNVNDFSEDMSKMRDIVDQHKTNKTPARNHPSVPGFQPETRSPYGVFDYNTNGYTGGPAPSSGSITDISEHPKFNSGDQGRSQKGRPFDRDEE